MDPIEGPIEATVPDDNISRLAQMQRIRRAYYEDFGLEPISPPPCKPAPRVPRDTEPCRLFEFGLIVFAWLSGIGMAGYFLGWTFTKLLELLS